MFEIEIADCNESDRGQTKHRLDLTDTQKAVILHRARLTTFKEVRGLFVISSRVAMT